MRASLLLIGVLATGCRGSTRGAEAEVAPLRTVMDTATVRRLCASADSVLAGRKQCDLRDQGVPAQRLPVRPE
jgi:hypothetical protein